MTRDRERAGWSWFEPDPARERPSRDVAEAFARCFRTPAGEQVLAYLCRTFLDRRVPPTASDSVLRHVEGQRSVVAHIRSLVEQGALIRKS
ncbi:hypothetical protein HRbin40_00138 [bacterium HR40]|nr:hypothetical protein HRbin40_00138 [bacterium HR40]